MYLKKLPIIKHGAGRRKEIQKKLKRHKRQDQKPNIRLIRVLLERLKNACEEAMSEESVAGEFSILMKICVLTNTRAQYIPTTI